MKTFIITNDATGSVVSVGIIYTESGDLTPGMIAFMKCNGKTGEAGILAYGEHIKKEYGLTTGHSVRIVDTTDLHGGNGLSYSKLYREAWNDSNDGPTVGVDMVKATAMAHARRRAKRQREQSVIAVQNSAAAATAAMNAYMKDVDDVAQVDIDAATTPDELEAAERTHGIVQ